MAKTPRVRDIGVDPDLLKAEARVEELEAELAKVKEQWEFAAKAQLERSEKAEADLRDTIDTLEAVKHSNRSLEAEVEKLREALLRVNADGNLLAGELKKAEAEVEKLREHGITYVSETLEREVELEAEVEKLRRLLGTQVRTDRLIERAEKAEAERDRYKRLFNQRGKDAADAEAERDRLRDQLREERAELEAEEHAAQLAVDEVRAERDRLQTVVENQREHQETRLELLRDMQGQRDRLAEALREIQACVGSSTEAWHIARVALEGKAE